MRMIALANQKGGCGKTTTAFHVGAGLAAQERRTLLIDADPQGHLSRLCGFAGQPPVDTLYAALQEPSRPLHHLIRPVRPHLELIPSHVLLSTLEQEWANRAGAVELLARALAQSWLNYDYVLIDCPPSLGFLTFNALRAATELLVPIDASYLSLAGVKQLAELVKLVDEQLHHRLIVKGVLTMIDQRTAFAKRFLVAAQREFPGLLYAAVIRHTVGLREASRLSRPVFEFAPMSNGAFDYSALVNTILEEERHIVEEQADLAAQPRTIRLAVKAPDAQTVYLVGDFTGWQLQPEHQFARVNDGRWVASVHLPPGEYRYKFVVDGQWLADPDNPRKAVNPFGTEDSLLVIPN